jgi:hypothetical protein
VGNARACFQEEVDSIKNKKILIKKGEIKRILLLIKENTIFLFLYHTNSNDTTVHRTKDP